MQIRPDLETCDDIEMIRTEALRLDALVGRMAVDIKMYQTSTKNQIKEAESLRKLARSRSKKIQELHSENINLKKILLTKGD